MKNALMLLLASSIFISCKMKENADLIIVNGNIYTVDSLFSKCTALAVREGIVLATGTDSAILERFQSAVVTDLEGASLFPGFNDAHCHLFSLGESLTTVDLRAAGSFEEILSRLKKRYDSEKSSILIGEGWDQNLWTRKEFPTNDELNRLFPEIPVLLTRIDFHAVLVNRAALDRLGISVGDGRIPPEEAVVINGKYSGIFLEKSADILKSAFLSEVNGLKGKETLLSAQNECFRYGLTSVSDADVSMEKILLMDSLADSGELKLRVDAWLSATSENRARFTKPYTKGRLRVATLKLYIDGALGSRGALMIEPYSDKPGYRGIMVESRESLTDWCQWAYQNGFQVATHAIGDSANREILRIYSSILPKENDLRWRVEHAQIVQPEDIGIFGEYSVIPSVQPTHATSDMLWADERLGDRIKYAYAYNELKKQLGWLPSGTDFPIEQVNPGLTFYSAVFRKNQEKYPQEGFNMENALSREDALRSMTIWAAKASFQERFKGSIEPGKFADFTVLDRDIMSCSESEVSDANVLITFVAGEPVYSK